MYARPAPLKPIGGFAFQWAPIGDATIGNYSMDFQNPIATYFPLTEAGSKEPREIEVKLSSRPSQRVVFALSVESPFDESTEVGQLRLSFADGSHKVIVVRYGEHVRTRRDPRLPMTAPAKNGVSAIDVELGAKAREIRTITITGTNPAAGLKLHAISAW